MKEKTKLPLILLISLPILLIISTELSKISFFIFEEPIYLISLIFPLTFLVSSIISKKTETRIAFSIVILSLILQCCVFVLKWVLLGVIDYALMEITFLAFFMSHFLLLIGYEILTESKRTDRYEYVLFLLFLASLIETMFYICIFPAVTISAVIITIVIKLIYDLIIAKVLTD